MAPLTDPTLLAHFRGALREWQCDGFVVWKPIAADWVRSTLEGQTPSQSPS